MATDKIVELNESNFHDHITAELPLLVDFWAPWCGPCRIVAPTLEVLAEEMDGKVRIGKLNVDDSPGIARQFQVQSIPTFIIFAGGEAKDRMMGARPKKAFEDFIARNA